MTCTRALWNEITQPDGETVEKVMIHEASTLLTTVSNSKVASEGLEERDDHHPKHRMHMHGLRRVPRFTQCG